MHCIFQYDFWLEETLGNPLGSRGSANLSEK